MTQHFTRNTVSALSVEQAEAKYHSPMTEDQMGESILALKREMDRDRWAKARGLKSEQVGIAVHPRSGKAFFQWNEALKCFNPRPR